MAENIQGAAALQRRLAAISGPHFGPALMRALGTAAAAEAKVLVHRKTGNLGRSIHVGKATENSVEVVASANYAAYVELGTKAHEITPNARKALRFAATAGGRRLSGTPRVGADVVFAKRVHHPGTKAYPYLKPGAEKAIEKTGLASKIVAAWNGAA